MAVTITPGFDFEVNGIPTKELLELMTAGMSITGIDISQIDATLVGMKDEPSSVSLPSEGWLWLDPMGAIHVKTSDGLVRFYRAQWGGWETNRYPIGNPIETFSLPTAHVSPIGKFRTHTVGSTNESDVYFRIGTGNIQQMVAHPTDTLVSGTAQPIVVRGAYYAETLSTDRTHWPQHIGRRAGGVTNAPVEPFPQTGVATSIHGLVTRQEGGGVVRGLAWYYGLEMMTD